MLSTMSDKCITFLKKITAVLFWLVLWQIAAILVNKKLLLASPIETLVRLTELASHHEFWFNVFVSLFRVMSGFVMGVLLGIITAYICFRYSWFELLMSPLLSVVRSTPVASLIVLSFVWIGRDKVPGFMALLMTFPVIESAILNGLKNVDKSLTEVADVYGAGNYQKAMYLYVPMVKNDFKACCITASGLAWKSGIAAEVICVPAFAIGKQIYEAKLYVETLDIFAWTVALIIISMLIEYLIRKLISMIN